VRSAPATLGARSAQWLQRMADAMLLLISTRIAATHRCAPRVRTAGVALAQLVRDSTPSTFVVAPI
jgi:hypothetical protein